MKRRGTLIGAIIAVAVLALAAWVASRTYWDELTIPSTLRGEAATYPMYAAEKLVQRLGAHVMRTNLFEAPAADSVIVLTDWNWDLGGGRREAMEQWVERGGRLVIDDTVYFNGGRFAEWSGLDRGGVDLKDDEAEEDYASVLREDGCGELRQGGEAVISGDPVDQVYTVCGLDWWAVVASERLPAWQLADVHGKRAVRVSIGAGSVTLIAGMPFAWREQLRGDNPDLLVAATRLAPGDTVHFLSEADHPGMPALIWRHGWPAVVLAVAALALALWRNGSRFGPLLPATEPVRRSLAEQIRGTGRFALRHGGGGGLHAACVRALERAAARRIAGFGTLAPEARLAAMADAGDVAQPALAAALHPPEKLSARALLAAIVQIESARRRILSDNPGRHHGNRTL